MAKAFGTGFCHGSLHYSAETDIATMDYEYCHMDDLYYIITAQVTVPFLFIDNPSQIEGKVKDAIIADVYNRVQSVIGQNDVKLL